MGPRKVSPRPDPSKFESGDFIWPKKPGAIVPYDSSLQTTYADAKAKWERERAAFVNRVKGDPNSSSEDRAAAAALSGMEFREFLARYLADETPEIPGAYTSGSPLYVGHVGILLIRDGKPHVIEAILSTGVRTVTYETWLSQRPDDLVWHGRAKDLVSADRSKISAEALKYLGRPYVFFNFNLNDDSGFYCSKLAWLAAFRSLGIALDGNPQALRAFWFSPKQLMHADRVYLLHDPGSYTGP